MGVPGCRISLAFSLVRGAVCATIRSSMMFRRRGSGRPRRSRATTIGSFPTERVARYWSAAMERSTARRSTPPPGAIPTGSSSRRGTSGGSTHISSRAKATASDTWNLRENSRCAGRRPKPRGHTPGRGPAARLERHHLGDARERHVERAPAVAARARGPDAAAARLDDLPADGEAEAFAGDLGVSRRAESRREDLLQVVGLHAGALIADRDDHLIVGRRDLDDDRRPRGRVLRRVPKQVIEDLREPDRLDARRDRQSRSDELDGASDDRPRPRDGLARFADHVRGLAALGGRAPEEIADELLHVVELRLHGGEVSGHERGVATHPGERVAQLVHRHLDRVLARAELAADALGLGAETARFGAQPIAIAQLIGDRAGRDGEPLQDADLVGGERSIETERHERAALAGGADRPGTRAEAGGPRGRPPPPAWPDEP